MLFYTRAIAKWCACVCRFLNVKELVVCCLMPTLSKRAGGDSSKDWTNPSACLCVGERGELAWWFYPGLRVQEHIQVQYVMFSL